MVKHESTPELPSQGCYKVAQKHRGARNKEFDKWASERPSGLWFGGVTGFRPFNPGELVLMLYKPNIRPNIAPFGCVPLAMAAWRP